MARTTIYKLAEQALSLIEGGDMPVASSLSINEIKIACSQVINSLLRTEYFNINAAIGETIPNGTVLALYEGVTVTGYTTGKSKATLPVKPLKLPRNMGVYSIFMPSQPDKEFIPLQMGQAALLKSQPMINDLLGQVGYEVFGDSVIFTKDLTQLFPNETVSMRLAILEISQYGDYDFLPIPPEMEFQVIQEVVKLYSAQKLPDKVVDATSKEQIGVDITKQSQSE
jgi:hypothetical protein